MGSTEIIVIHPTIEAQNQFNSRFAIYYLYAYTFYTIFQVRTFQSMHLKCYKLILYSLQIPRQYWTRAKMSMRVFVSLHSPQKYLTKGLKLSLPSLSPQQKNYVM